MDSHLTRGKQIFFTFSLNFPKRKVTRSLSLSKDPQKITPLYENSVFNVADLWGLNIASCYCSILTNSAYK
jgi:hypothetical protein